MTISLTCTCGVRLEVDETFAGQTISCPDCQRSLVAPKPEQPGLQTSGLALGSLTLALIGAFTVVGTLAAILLGVLGLRVIARAPDKVTGRGYALTGITLGAVLTVLTLFALTRGELFGLNALFGQAQWAGKLVYDGPDEVVRDREGFAITRPSRKWGVYRSTTNAAGLPELPGNFWEDLLLVNVEEDAQLLVMPQRMEGDLEACRVQALKDFREQDKAGLFGKSRSRGSMGKTVVVKGPELLKSSVGTVDVVEMEIVKSLRGQERRFIVRVCKDRAGLGGLAFVLIGGARASRFDRVQQEIRKAMDTFRIL